MHCLDFRPTGDVIGVDGELAAVAEVRLDARAFAMARDAFDREPVAAVVAQ